MIQSRKTLAAVALTGLVVGFAAMAAVPSIGSARSVAAGDDVAILRIETAFEVASAARPAPAIEAAAGRVHKGDLQVSADCADEKWPEITARCLTAADGSAVPAVRTVTIGHSTAEATTVLMRMPAPQIASR